MQDAWRAYLELALGMGETSMRRAQTVAKRMVGQSGATAAQLQTLAEQLRSTGLDKRDVLSRLVRAEVDRALGAVGLASADEVAALTARVRELELAVATSRATAPAGAGTTPAAVTPGGLASAAATKSAAQPGPAKKVAAKKAA